MLTELKRAGEPAAEPLSLPGVYAAMNHPMRVPLAAEVHSRPALELSGSESVTHFAVYAPIADAGIGATQQQILAALCLHFGVTPPGPTAKYFNQDFGRFRLKWECHTEFATYTFAQRHEQPLPLDEAFERVPLMHVPRQWLLELQGKIMVAVHVVLEQCLAPNSLDDPAIRDAFEGRMLVGSRVQRGGEIWTDFLIQADGFSRFVVRDISLRAQQAARLVQRVLEIETYRMMALLGLPLAQQFSPVLNAIESELAELTETMVSIEQAQAGASVTAPSSSSSHDAEQELLHSITGLAARVEKLSLESSYRFSASLAYFRLVKARIGEMREVRIANGVPTLSEFMDRRLSPAMNTCEAVARRQETLAERIAHTNDLLRTRVGIVQEQQNREILQSMNRRAAQQLRLQQSVEGLSVAAITYYVAGLFSYAGKALKASGLPINPDVATGLLVPVIAAAVWLGLRRLHRSLH